VISNKSNDCELWDARSYAGGLLVKTTRGPKPTTRNPDAHRLNCSFEHRSPTKNKAPSSATKNRSFCYFGGRWTDAGERFLMLFPRTAPRSGTTSNGFFALLL